MKRNVTSAREINGQDTHAGPEGISKLSDIKMTLTFKMLWAADKLDAREQADSTRQQHRKGPELQSPLGASTSGGSVPPGKLPAPGLVVDVVEETAFRHEERVRLEWTFCRQTLFVVMHCRWA